MLPPISRSPHVVDAIEHLVQNAPDADLNRINALAFAAASTGSTKKTIAAFLHAARLGHVRDVVERALPGMRRRARGRHEPQDGPAGRSYSCALCGAGYEPTLDEMVEVTFTVTPRVRQIAAHDPDTLPMWDYDRQFFWGSGIDLPENFEEIIEEIVLDLMESAAGERASLSLQLPSEFIIVFEPVTHSAQFIDVKGEPTRERQNLSMVFNELHPQHETVEMRPGPLRLSLDNRTTRRVLPSVWVAGDRLHDYARATPAVPDGKPPAHQPDLPRSLSHRHARHRPAAEDHQPDLPVHRSQGLDRSSTSGSATWSPTIW